MTQEKPCDSKDTANYLQVMDAKVAYRIPTGYSQEEVDAFNYNMLSAGWTVVASIATLGFISPDGSWYRGIDAKTRCYINMPIGHARRLGFCGPYEEKSVEIHEIRVPCGYCFRRKSLGRKWGKYLDEELLDKHKFVDVTDRGSNVVDG